MKIRNLFLALVLGVLLIVGCTKRIESVTAPIDRVELKLEQPEPLSLTDIEYYIITHNGETFLAIKMNDFRALAKNAEDMQNFILIQKDQLEEYKRYYERTRKAGN